MAHTETELENARAVLTWLNSLQSLIADNPLNAEMREQSPYLASFVDRTQSAMENPMYHRIGIIEQYVNERAGK